MAKSKRFVTGESVSESVYQHVESLRAQVEHQGKTLLVCKAELRLDEHIFNCGYPAGHFGPHRAKGANKAWAMTWEDK